MMRKIKNCREMPKEWEETKDTLDEAGDKIKAGAKSVGDKIKIQTKI